MVVTGLEIWRQMAVTLAGSAQTWVVTAPSIKITLALQNVCGPLANALSLSINEKSTWNDGRTLLLNYFNNSIPTDSKEIYQFISGKASKEDSVNQVGKKGKSKSKKSQGQSKGKGSS